MTVLQTAKDTERRPFSTYLPPIAASLPAVAIILLPASRWSSPIVRAAIHSGICQFAGNDLATAPGRIAISSVAPAAAARPVEMSNRR